MENPNFRKRYKNILAGGEIVAIGN